MNKWLDTLKEWIIDAEEKEFKRVKRFSARVLRFCWMLGENFVRDRCTQKTAALTYTSILSLFPLLAVISIFATHFYGDGETKVEDKIVSVLENYLLPSEVDEAPVVTPDGTPDDGDAPLLAVDDDASTTTLQAVPAESNGVAQSRIHLRDTITGIFEQFRVRTGTIAGVGLLGLLLSAIALFMSCEKFFNEIWRAPTKRPFMKTFSAFCSVLVCMPILIGASTIVSNFFHDKVTQLEEAAFVGGFAKFLFGFGGQLVPFILISFTLALAFYLIPNTRVRFRAALAGGLFSGLLWMIAKGSFFVGVRLMPITESVFGAVGAPLVFLVWLHLLWAIIFLGAEAAYLTQHLDYVVRERFESLRYTLDDPRVYVLVLGRIAEAYQRDEGGIDFTHLRRQTSLCDSDLEAVLTHLHKSKILAMRDDGKWMLERPPEHIRLEEILNLGCRSASLLRAHEGEREDLLMQKLGEMDGALIERFGEKTLRDFIEQT